MSEASAPQKPTRLRRKHIVFMVMLLVTFSVFSFSVVSVTVWDVPLIPSTKAEDKLVPQNNRPSESTDQRILESLVNRLTKELDEIRSALATSNREKSELLATYHGTIQIKNELETVNSKLRLQIDEQLRQLERQREEKESLVKTTSKTEGDLALTKQELTKIQESKTASEKLLSETNQTINTLRYNLAQSEERLKAVNAKLETSTSNLQQTQAELENTKREFEKLLAASISTPNTSNEITGATYMEALRNECEKKYEFAIKNVSYVVETIASQNGKSKWVPAGQFMNSFEPKQYPCIGRTRQANDASEKWAYFKVEEKLTKYAPGVAIEMVRAGSNVTKSRYSFTLKDTVYDVEIIREKDKVYQWVSAGTFRNFYEPAGDEFCRAKKAGNPPSGWEYFKIEK